MTEIHCYACEELIDIEDSSRIAQAVRYTVFLHGLSEAMLPQLTL